MGECGCAATNPEVQFPGPDGVRYALEVYPGCEYCDTPVGIILHRIDPDVRGAEVAMQYLERVPELDFHGLDNWAITEAAIPIVEPHTLGNAYLVADQPDAPPTVFHVLQDAVHDALNAWRES